MMPDSEKSPAFCLYSFSIVLGMCKPKIYEKKRIRIRKPMNTYSLKSYLMPLLLRASLYRLAFCRCSLYVRAKLCVPLKSSLAHIYI